jgi:hypothetical protein
MSDLYLKMKTPTSNSNNNNNRQNIIRHFQTGNWMQLTGQLHPLAALHLKESPRVSLGWEIEWDPEPVAAWRRKEIFLLLTGIHSGFAALAIQQSQWLQTT